MTLMNLLHDGKKTFRVLDRVAKQRVNAEKKNPRSMLKRLLNIHFL